MQSKKIDESIVKLSDWLLRKVKRGGWTRGSNQRMRSWYFRRHYGYLVEEYKAAAIPTGQNDGPVWMFWWQGEESMPPIVRKCYDLAVAHAPEGHPVILLTERNCRDYAYIPEYIINKVRRKAITLTHFSDILRVSLLWEHGGVWMDATMYTAAEMPAAVFSKPFFSVRTPDDGQWVSRCLWTGFFMGGVKGHPLFGLVRQLFFDYWKGHEELLDYFLIDVGIVMAYDGIPQIRNSVDDGVWLTDKLYYPQNHIDQLIDIDLYRQMVREWPFFKMTYRDYFGKLMVKNDNGEYTWYGYMLTH